MTAPLNKEARSCDVASTPRDSRPSKYCGERGRPEWSEPNRTCVQAVHRCTCEKCPHRTPPGGGLPRTGTLRWPCTDNVYWAHVKSAHGWPPPGGGLNRIRFSDWWSLETGQATSHVGGGNVAAAADVWPLLRAACGLSGHNGAPPPARQPTHIFRSRSLRGSRLGGAGTVPRRHAPER